MVAVVVAVVTVMLAIMDVMVSLAMVDLKNVSGTHNLCPRIELRFWRVGY